MMDFDPKEALEALGAYLRSLPKPKPPLACPEWAYAEAGPVAAYTIRGHRCYAFGLAEAMGAITGYILDADGLVAYPVRDGNVQIALDLVARW